MAEPWPRNRAFQGAYEKGRRAFLTGLDVNDCPYKDKRAGKYDHIITYSRGFINAWVAGYQDEKLKTKEGG